MNETTQNATEQIDKYENNVNNMLWPSQPPYFNQTGKNGRFC